MMKAILVIDKMPKNCDECRLNIEGICSATDERIYSIRCPLKPLPQKMNRFPKKGVGVIPPFYADGWNNCIDELLGETE